MVFPIGDEVTRALELEPGLCRRRRQRWLDEGGDDPLAARLQVIEIVAFDRLGFKLVLAGNAQLERGQRLAAAMTLALRIARPGERDAEQAIVEPNLRANGLVDAKPVDVALHLARLGAGRSALRRRVVRAMHDGHVAAGILLDT